MTASKVTITDHAIISALNTPGGGVYRWRDEVGREIKNVAQAMAPINDPLNAMHRGGEVGSYKRGFDWDRRGSNGHSVTARVTNSAPHASIVEWGRNPSSKMQIFTWARLTGQMAEGQDISSPNKVRVGGPVKRKPQFNTRTGKMSKLSRKSLAFNERIGKLPPRIGKRTAQRAGQHILGKATVAVLGSAGILARVDM